MKKMVYKREDMMRGCNLNPCRNNLGGDINKPMCYVCDKNPYLPIVKILAEHIFRYSAKGRNVDWSCARSGSRWNCYVAAWKALVEIIPMSPSGVEEK